MIAPRSWRPSPAPPPRAIAAYEQTGGSNIVVVEPCPPGMAHHYGVVALDGGQESDRLRRMTGMVEKPLAQPSNRISGRRLKQQRLGPSARRRAVVAHLRGESRCPRLSHPLSLGHEASTDPIALGCDCRPGAFRRPRRWPFDDVPLPGAPRHRRLGRFGMLYRATSLAEATAARRKRLRHRGGSSAVLRSGTQWHRRLPRRRAQVVTTSAERSRCARHNAGLISPYGPRATSTRPGSRASDVGSTWLISMPYKVLTLAWDLQ